MFSNCHTLYMFIQSSLLYCFRHLRILIPPSAGGNSTLCEGGVVARVSSGLHSVNSWPRNELRLFDLKVKICAGGAA